MILSIRVNDREVELSERRRAMVVLILAAARLDEFEGGVLELHFRGKHRQSVKAHLRPNICVLPEVDAVAVDSG